MGRGSGFPAGRRLLLAVLVGVTGGVLQLPLAAAPSGGPARVLQEGMWGQDVFHLQLVLEELGLRAQDPPGYFGPGTRQAAVRLQQVLGLEPDGVVGPETRRVLDSFSTRYVYRVRPGDTLWEVARRFGTTMEALVDENDLGDQPLRAGQTLVVPSVRKLYVPRSVSLVRLARQLGVPAGLLASINGLSVSDTLRAGSEIWTPLPQLGGG